MPDFHTALSIGLLSGCVLVWSLVARRMVQRLPVVPDEPRRPAPWTVVDVLLAGLAAVALNMVCIGSAWMVAGAQRGELPEDFGSFTAEERLPFVVANSVWQLLTMASAMAIVKLRRRATWRDLGLDFSRAGGDIALGIAALFAITLPLMLVQGALIEWLDYPSEHPVLEMLKQQPSFAFLLWTGIATVVVAPVAEEFLFRGFFQAWLEAAVEDPIHAGRAGRALNAAPRRLLNATPIVASSALFAAGHAQHGPDPVPLFLFALALGYLYRRTHRLLPCMVTHALFNFLTIAATWVEVTGGLE